MKALVFWRPTSPTASQYVEHMNNIGILSFSKTYLPQHIMKIIDVVGSSLSISPFNLKQYGQEMKHLSV